MKPMKELPYHYGIKMRIYPSDEQKRIIKVNSDASRFVYNQMVSTNKEIYELNKIKFPIDTVLIRLEQLNQRLNAKQLSNHYLFLNDSRIDSLTKANAIQNYHKAWHAFRKVHTAGVPKFHRKSYAWKYQTNCQYPGKKQALLTNGTVKFVDNKHVIVPKLGKLRLSGSQQRILTRTAETRIGTVTIFKDVTNRFYLSMQLASDTPFVEKVQHNGKQLVTVSPYKTSQICSSCGYDDGKHALAIRAWACPNCGQNHIRDWNAASNILDKGIKKLTAVN